MNAPGPQRLDQDVASSFTSPLPALRSSDDGFFPLEFPVLRVPRSPAGTDWQYDIATGATKFEEDSQPQSDDSADLPPVYPTDKHPPCNTLYVGNLHLDTSEDELKEVFSKQAGYKRLCFRTKYNGPSCFVEFERITYATRALKDLQGYTLHNSTITLGYSKNSLGPRLREGTRQPPQDYVPVAMASGQTSEAPENLNSLPFGRDGLADHSQYDSVEHFRSESPPWSPWRRERSKSRIRYGASDSIARAGRQNEDSDRPKPNDLVGRASITSRARSSSPHFGSGVDLNLGTAQYSEQLEDDMADLVPLETTLAQESKAFRKFLRGGPEEWPGRLIYTDDSSPLDWPGAWTDKDDSSPNLGRKGRKEQKQRNKVTKGQRDGMATFEETPPIKAEEPDDYFKPTLSKKDQKKRNQLPETKQSSKAKDDSDLRLSTKEPKLQTSRRDDKKGRSPSEPLYGIQGPAYDERDANHEADVRADYYHSYESPDRNTRAVVQRKVEASGFETQPTVHTLQELVVKGDNTPVCQLLEEHFEDVAQEDFDWLHELLDIGCSCAEMAKLLIDGEKESPWIRIAPPSLMKAEMLVRFHQENCVHQGGHEVSNSPQVRHAHPLEIPGKKAKEIISEYCGIAGILPLEVEDSWSNTSYVQFENANSCAWISTSENTERKPEVSLISQLRYDMERIMHAIGFLQASGLCCDSISILRIRIGYKRIQLCNIDIHLLKGFYFALIHWKKDVSTCNSWARQILKLLIGGAAYFNNNFQNRVPDYELIVQCLFVAILSYVQAHIGGLHPRYLVKELKTIHLLGSQTLEQSNLGSGHVVVELLDFTCMKDMVGDSALVFRHSSNNLFAKEDARFDLLASPEDIAETWGPARFIADLKMGPRALQGIEIGGGTIGRMIEDPEKFHWSLGQSFYSNDKRSFDSKEKILIGGTTINRNCPLDETKSWRHPTTNGYLKHLGTYGCSWELRERQAGLQGGQYAVLQFNAIYVKQNGVTLKQQQLMLPFNEIDLAFLNSTCGLQVSFCTGVARRVALRELLGDVMVPFVESRIQRPAHWEDLKTRCNIVENFRTNALEQWFENLTREQRDSVIQIVRSMLEVLKDTGIDKNGEELVIAWVRKESPHSSLRLRCEKTSLWARILADSEDCATFACITPLCLQSDKHKCRCLEVAPWHNVSNLLDTAVCPQLSNREPTTIAATLTPFNLQHQVSYWIGKSGSNMIAKVWLTNVNADPILIVRQKVIPEKYRARFPKNMVERLGRLRERQASETVAKQVLILTEI